MKKKIFLAALALFMMILPISAADDITGFWKSISDATGLPESITAIYEYNGRVFGRIIVTYDDKGVAEDTIDAPTVRAELIKGDPYFAGLDFIWNMKPKGEKWSKGKIMDPPVAKTYSCEMWMEEGNLIVRGKIGPFGRNQTWFRATAGDLPEGFNFPDIAEYIPHIPEKK